MNAVVEISTFDSSEYEVVPPNPQGLIRIPKKFDGKSIKALITPIDGHWSVLVPNPQSLGVINFSHIDRPRASMWWKTLVNCKQDCRDNGKGLKIGIIDLPFERTPYLNHVRIFDIEGNEITDRPEGPSHGSRVCKILAERGDTEERSGIAAGAEFVLIDVSDELTGHTWDFEKIAPAIQILADEFNVDVINISGGAFIDFEDPEFAFALEFLSETIEYAKSYGVTVIAAVGNDQSKTVAWPACSPSVIGVGAIGLSNLAPPGSMTYGYQLGAEDTPGCCGSISDDQAVFHHFGTSIGAGLDVVGPGIGIVMCMDNGVTVEYQGTSYAAPIVTGALVVALSRDEKFIDEAREDRVKFTKRHLTEMCIDLGMERDRQGMGLPIVKI